ncbi:hypothetical protein [Desulfoluna spongiiphila]|uniref:Uncharacterized protein n=1 Tax=Desulfoluna spongiiphila TaxID=419481 RepID=A0A1G5JTI6_9BACT|nr:hypothetical protein [Desulfoluna spongiiphila]SCY91464.1 hypothetical protein SAMN05216233_1502 [Desulfoluna spongiiphila]
MNLINEDTILDDLRDLIQRFDESLVRRVDPAGLTLKSKIPFKVLSLKEVLFHRITILAQEAFDLYLQNKRMPSYILMRSTVETCALCFSFRKKCSIFLEDFNVANFDSFLMKGLSGGRIEKAKYQSVNVLTCIDHVDREFEGFRKMYDVLCEYAHPNHLGTLDSLGKFDNEKIWLDLGTELKMPPPAFGLAPFCMSLIIFEEQYNLIGDILRDINKNFDEKII